MDTSKPAAGTGTDPGPDAVDAITAQWNAVRPELDVTAMGVFGRIYRISRGMGEEMDRVYARFGISRGEFDVIATLRRSGAPYTLSPRRLADTMMITTGGMTGRLDKLEKAGLLSRSPDPNDRRGLQVTITDKGLELIDEAVVAGLRAQQAALAGFGEEETELLTHLLRRLLAGM
ncbi:MarR family winged helix-turn-helix transcriptional regulator [Streptomyces sp. NPDC012888]|uniref:MarR family winged helix-turn-helix transcriptional regulator n=1 Tax=Streptomyces sp. NPDC012888 TaxID=3364855 RepID=UPI0036B759DB